MKLKYLPIFIVPFVLIGCNNSNVNKTKSPFNDSYNPLGMNGQYTINKSIDTDDYNKLKTSIIGYTDNKVSSYTREEQTRDLKSAYFGRNLGAANLCSLTSQTTNNTRYSNNVTTKFADSHKENQTVTGGINKTDSHIYEYIFADTSVGTNGYSINQQTWNDKETKVVKTVESGTYDPNDLDKTFGLNPYTKDIKNNFVIKSRKDEKLIDFSVLADNNNAVYGITNINNAERYVIREAISDFATYSTTVGDTYKCVDNFFYECLLEKVDNNFRFTNFRFYKELLILSEAFTDESKIPVLYLEKPQLVEYSEIKYTINYDTLKPYEGDIPKPEK